MEIPDPTTLQGITFHPSPACGYCWKLLSRLVLQQGLPESRMGYAQGGRTFMTRELALLCSYAHIVHKDVVHAMISSWEDITAERQRKKEWFRRKMPPSKTVLDIMPAVAMVEGTNHASTHFYPILALRCGTTAALPKGIRTLCMDVIEMCYITVNAGLVLRRYECTGCWDCYIEPVMGKMVKHKKKWEWEEIAGFNWLMMKRPFSGVPPAKVWALYDAL